MMNQRARPLLVWRWRTFEVGSTASGADLSLAGSS